MYSETAVRMSSNQMTDEGFDQRCTLLSHLSYVPGDSSGDGGTRTHNPRITNHVLQSAVGHVSVATKVGQSYPLPSERRLPKTVASGGGRNRTMYSNPAVAVVSKCPTKGCQERCLLRPSVPATKSPIVDRPLRLREIPAPFTSRSPGIATLGPSCTPSRQLGSVVKLSKAQRGFIETGLFGSQIRNLDVVPTGSWAVV